MSIIDNIKKSLGFEENNKSDIKSDFDGEYDGSLPTSITPVNSFLYEIILIRPKTSDDVDYIYDQIVKDENPVIIDIKYLENEGPDSFQMVGDKIKVLRENHNAEAISLSKSENKNLILITPSKVKIIKKE
jgi:SepF-like predicted cell division protein (DUF552 family)